MLIKYKLEKEDFLNFQLFAASQSERIMKKKRNTPVFLSLLTLTMGVCFYLMNNIPLTVYSVALTFLFCFLYPKYSSWRYKKHYQAYINENYNNRFGKSIELEFNQDAIKSKDKTGEGMINLSEVAEVCETFDYLFVRISTGITLIIPKRELLDVESLKNHFILIGLNIIDKLDWKWT